jgi:hypothetical protein
MLLLGLTLALGLTLLEALPVDGLGEDDGEAEREAEDDGETEGDTDGETEAEGLTLGLALELATIAGGEVI